MNKKIIELNQKECNEVFGGICISKPQEVFCDVYFTTAAVVAAATLGVPPIALVVGITAYFVLPYLAGEFDNKRPNCTDPSNTIDNVVYSYFSNTTEPNP